MGTKGCLNNGIDGFADYQTTPPLPATSSPGGMDVDMSPIAMQKNAYVAQMEVHSPTPIISPEDDDEMTLDSPAPIVPEGLKPVAELVLSPISVLPRAAKLTFDLLAASRVSAVLLSVGQKATLLDVSRVGCTLKTRSRVSNSVTTVVLARPPPTCH